MISRWPTMTFSTSLLSAWKEEINCSTRGSCVMRSPLRGMGSALVHIIWTWVMRSSDPVGCNRSAKPVTGVGHLAATAEIARNEGTVAFDIGSEHRAAAGQRFEDRVRHSALGERAIEHDVALGQ